MKIHFVSNNRRVLASFLTALILLPACVLIAQGTQLLTKPGNYTGRNITGELVRNQRVNISQLASAPTGQVSSAGAEIQRHREDALHPPVRDSGGVISRMPAAPLAAAAAPTPSFRGFPGLTQKRNGGLSSPGPSPIPLPVYLSNRAGYISPSARLLIQPVTISFTPSIPRWRTIPTRAGRVSPTSRTSRSITMASTSASTNSTLPRKATLTGLLMLPFSPLRKTI